MFFDKNSSKYLVFSVLSEEWPLSAREVYLRVCKISGKDVSYQAIHKLLNSLLDEHILVKIDSKYQINSEWILSTKDLLSKIEKNLEAKELVSPLNQKMIFESVYEVDKFLISACEQFTAKKEDDLALVWVHYWIPLFFENIVYKKMRDLIFNSNFYSITPSNSNIDKWCADFWKKAGVREKTGVKLGFEISLMVFKDIIVQVFYPKEIRDELDKVYNSTKNISELNLDNFFSTVFEKKTRIPVLISRNKEVAEELMNQIKSNFD